MHFEKITREQWVKNMVNLHCLEHPTEANLEKINKLYDNIKLPKRATKYSAGYDFYAPEDFVIPPNTAIKIVTGVRWVCEEWEKDRVLLIAPRSGMGFRHGVRLMNTIGIVDAKEII